MSYALNILTPTDSTQAHEFIQTSKCNGAGVIIAILDTGVDAGAAGLQVCPDGSRKVIDVVDCTGSGDVDTRTIVAASTDGIVQGLSGRHIRLNPGWTNPSGQWRIGLKRANEVFPAPLLRRLEASLRQQAVKKVADLQLQVASDLARCPVEDAGLQAELAARAELLGGKGGLAALGLEDALSAAGGAEVDVLAWHDGAVWRAAVDTAGTGDLSAAVGMADYRLEGQLGVWSAESLLTFAINVYEGGDVVSIVTDAGAHGTHVAGIAAGYHPHHPHLNGVAPGARIVSCKIGDTRLGSMETALGLSRALSAVVRAGAHVVNMSYGEPASAPAAGRFAELATLLVQERGVIFVSSAGNAGPALSTNGAPGATHPLILGIGAAVSRGMQGAQYSMRARYRARAVPPRAVPPPAAAAAAAGLEDVPPPPPLPLDASSAGSGEEGPAAAEEAAADGSDDDAGDDRARDTGYTWTSRGPGIDGCSGVSVAAPGGSINTVPCWSLSLTQLMNGTSMASPNAAGCVALLLSGLAARELPPPGFAALKRALEATAAPLAGAADVFGVGAGLLQVRAAFEHLLLQQRLRSHLGGARAAGRLHAFPFCAVASPLAAAAGAAEAAAAEGGGAIVAEEQHDHEEPIVLATVDGGGVSPGEATDRGVYLRNPHQTAAAADFTVTVKPTWSRRATSAVKVSYQTLFSLRLRLRHYSTAGGGSTVYDDTSLESAANGAAALPKLPALSGIVSLPDAVLVAHGGRSFVVHVDPTSLPPGALLHAEIEGVPVLPPAALRQHTAAAGGGGPGPALGGPGPASTAVAECALDLAADLGPTFRVPVTICVPEAATSSSLSAAAAASAAPADIDGGGAAGGPTSWSSPEHALTAGSLRRHFLAVPAGAAWAEVLVTRTDDGGDDVAPRLLVVHAMTVARNLSGKLSAAHEYVQLRPRGDADGFPVPVLEGSTLEVALAQAWSSLGATRAVLRVSFRGVSASPAAIAMAAGEGPVPLSVTAALHDVTLRPAGALTATRTYLRPLPAGAGAPALAALAAAWPLYGAALCPGLHSLADLGSVLPLRDAGRDTLLSGRREHVLTLAYHLPLAAPAPACRLWNGWAHGVLYEGALGGATVVVLEALPRVPAPAPALLASSDGGGAGAAPVTAAYLPLPRVAGVSDAFPERLTLDAREYVALLQLRSDDPAALEAYAAAAARGHGGQAALVFEAALGRDAHVPLALYTSAPAACSDAGGLTGSRTLRLPAGATGRYFLGAPGAGAALADAAAKQPLPPHEALGHLLLEDYAHTSAPAHRAAAALKPGQRTGLGGGLQFSGGGGPAAEAHRVAHRDPAGTPVTLTLAPPPPLPAKGAAAASSPPSSSSPLPEALWLAALAHLSASADPWASKAGGAAADALAPTGAAFDAEVELLLAGCDSGSGAAANTAAAVASPLTLRAPPPTTAAAAANEGRLRVLLAALRRRDDTLGGGAAGSGAPPPLLPPSTVALSSSGRLLDSAHAAAAAAAATSAAVAARVAAVVASAAAVVAAVDTGALAAHFGTLHGADAAAGADLLDAAFGGGGAAASGSSAAASSDKAVHAAMTAARDALAEAAWRAARVQLRGIGSAVAAATEAPAEPAFESASAATAVAAAAHALPLAAAARLLRAWLPKTDLRHTVLALEAALRTPGRSGTALRLLRTLQDDKGAPRGDKGDAPAVAPEVLRRLWAHCLRQLRWDAPLAAAAPDVAARAGVV